MKQHIYIMDEIHVQLVPESNKLPYVRVELEFMTHGCKVFRQYKSNYNVMFGHKRCVRV